MSRPVINVGHPRDWPFVFHHEHPRGKVVDVVLGNGITGSGVTYTVDLEVQARMVSLSNGTLDQRLLGGMLVPVLRAYPGIAIGIAAEVRSSAVCCRHPSGRYALWSIHNTLWSAENLINHIRTWERDRFDFDVLGELIPIENFQPFVTPLFYESGSPIRVSREEIAATDEDLRRIQELVSC